MTDSKRIQHRQLEASRRELVSMTSEIEHYGYCFTDDQLTQMHKAKHALQNLIDALEGHKLHLTSEKFYRIATYLDIAHAPSGTWFIVTKQITVNAGCGDVIIPRLWKCRKITSNLNPYPGNLSKEPFTAFTAPPKFMHNELAPWGGMFRLLPPTVTISNDGSSEYDWNAFSPLSIITD